MKNLESLVKSIFQQYNFQNDSRKSSDCENENSERAAHTVKDSD